MAVCLAFRFVSGAYAATAWDSSANSGTVEWPPSPWRISRALLAVAHDRLPEDDLATVMDVISSLAEQHPVYLVPPRVPNHTRHYLPDLDHRSGQTGGTSLTLNSMLTVPPDQPLHVSWPSIDLTPEQDDCLARCVSHLSYLGRAESLVDATVEPDLPAARGHQLLVPGGNGGETVRLLCPDPEATRDQLEITPDHMRKNGFLTPPGATWVEYDTADEVIPHLSPHRRAANPTIVRWALDSRAPLRETYGILATDRLRGLELKALLRTMGNVPVTLTGHFPRSAQGQQETKTDHGHAHWIWLATDGRVTDLVLWVPSGIDPKALPQLARPAELSSQGTGYTPQGFVDCTLQLTGIGTPEQVAGELVSSGSGSTTWESVTPYLLTRHMKRNRDLSALITDDVCAEWGYREQGPAEVISVERIPIKPEVREFRRYRWKETMADRRAGFGLRVTFSDPVQGPVALGALSHFGFGRFRPIGEP